MASNREAKRFGDTMMRLQLLAISLTLAGCTSAPPDPQEFVQGKIRITPPVARVPGPPAIGDGGTLEVLIRDAKGREFVVFIDHRIHGPTPGAIYLNAYPNRPNSIRVRNEPEFKRKVGDFDYQSPTPSAPPSKTGRTNQSAPAGTSSYYAR